MGVASVDPSSPLQIPRLVEGLENGFALHRNSTRLQGVNILAKRVIMALKNAQNGTLFMGPQKGCLRGTLTAPCHLLIALTVITSLETTIKTFEKTKIESKT